MNTKKEICICNKLSTSFIIKCIKHQFVLWGVLLMSSVLASCSNSSQDNQIVKKSNAVTYRVKNEQTSIQLPLGIVEGLYSGDMMMNGNPHGEGTFITEDANGVPLIYSGYWVDGVMNGPGKRISEGKFTVEGEYVDGVLSGEGTYSLPTGETVRAIFQNDEIERFVRESVSVEGEPMHYVKLHDKGFKIPDSWKHDFINNTMTIDVSDPRIIMIVYYDTQNRQITDSTKEILNNLARNQDGYNTATLIDETFSNDDPLYPTYKIHYVLKNESAIDDVYCEAVVSDSGTLVIYLLEMGLVDDYYQAAQCIPNSLRNWEYIEKTLDEEQNDETSDKDVIDDNAEVDILTDSEIKIDEDSIEEERDSSPAETDSLPAETTSSLLDGLDLTPSELKEIYNEFEAAWDPSLYPEDVNEVAEYEEKVAAEIAKKHGITSEQASHAYSYVILYGTGKNTQSVYKMLYGTFLDATINGTTLVIKAKIEPNLTNDMTISQNYYNVCDVIRNQGGNEFEEIQYWAVADMSNGSEEKVISFTVPKNVINTINGGSFADNTLDEYVDDLWISPGLQG